MKNLVISIMMVLVLLVPSTGFCQGWSWTWSKPLPQGNNLNAAWMVPGGDLFSAGNNGTIVHYDGSTWSVSYWESLVTLTDIWGTSDSNVYAAGNYISGPITNGRIMHYNGADWTLFYSSTDELWGIWGTSSSDIFAVGESIFHYNGSTWLKQRDGGAFEQYRNVWGTSPTDVYVGGENSSTLDSVLLKYNGSTWADMSGLPSFHWGVVDVWSTAATDVYVVSGAYGVTRYDGVTWNLMIGSDVASFTDIWGYSSTDIFTANEKSVYHYDGASWTRILDLGILPDHRIYGINGSSATTTYVTGEDGLILQYTGSTWTTRTEYLDTVAESMYAIWGTSSTDMFFVGRGGTILRYDGTSYQTQSLPVNADLYGICGFRSDNIFSVGRRLSSTSDGYIFHYEGSTWSVSLTAPTAFYRDVWGIEYEDVFVAGHDDTRGLILNFDGATWTVMFSATGRSFYSIHGFASNNVFASGVGRTTPTLGPVMHYDGVTWNRLPEQPCTACSSFHAKHIWGTSETDMFVAESSDIFHWDGVTWDSESDMGSEVQDIWGISPTEVYAALSTEGLMGYYNGSTWSTLPIPPDYNTWAIWGPTADTLFCSAGSGNILIAERGNSPVPVSSWLSTIVVLLFLLFTIIRVGIKSVADC